MGVPSAIIVMIILIMAMFLVAALILYKNKERFFSSNFEIKQNEKTEHTDI